ncbi:MAG TPA: hypothetical protein VG166_03280 [Caulobacteraceae bacterium]|jgi:hypothetical protein|nr:hypothetical protein [Caulobacteraceae bacterium]
MLALVLAFTLPLLGHHHGAHRPKAAPVVHRFGYVHGWRYVISEDAFTGQLSCALFGHGMHVRNQSVIFELGSGVETTHAVYRLDAGQPHPVSAGFTEDESHGIFPERGFIDDKNGGETVLPLHYLTGARHIWIRATPKYRPVDFDLKYLTQAMAVARLRGCPAWVI